MESDRTTQFRRRPCREIRELRDDVFHGRTTILTNSPYRKINVRKHSIVLLRYTFRT